MSRPVRNPLGERLLRREEVAEAFRVDPRTVSQWARRGLIATVVTPGGQRRYRETDVRALLEGSASPPGTPLSDEQAGLSERDEL